MNVSVESAGFLTTVQDLGRMGHRQSGVSTGGALDSFALRVANALVGNDDSAAGLELTLGSVRLRFSDSRVIAWCGGAFAVRIGDQERPAGHAGVVLKNEALTVTAPSAGARAWLAISGGIDVPLILGSHSTDLRGNFGGHEGRALRDGDLLPLGTTTAAPWISEGSAPAPWAATAQSQHFLRVVRGPDWDRFTPDAQAALFERSFLVTPDSDRMGVRFDGPNLERNDSGDLLSEAVAPGTLQVPPAGRPILLLGDCQTIGGYPKIAHVITVDLPFAAQLSPGNLVRFKEVSLAEAQALLREREDDFTRFRIGLRLQTS